MDFSRFFRSKDADPTALWTALSTAVHSGDTRHFEALCRDNQETILEHFAEWRVVPENLRSDPTQTEHYVKPLVAIAQHFAQQLGRPELMQLLVGNQESNPAIQWQQQFNQAHQLMGQLRYAEAAESFARLLGSAQTLGGPDAGRWLSLANGFLGESLFQSGRPDQAVAYFETALALCQERAEQEGIIAHLGNLLEAHRYLGQIDQAVHYAEALAAAYNAAGQVSEAQTFHGRAERMRQGEPLCRIVVQSEGGNVEVEQFAQRPGRTYQFVFERNRISLHLTEALNQQGGQAATEGNGERALEFFAQAAKLDPCDPAPHYHRAMCLLEMDRYTEAAEAFAETEQRAPGWYFCRMEKWLAEQLAAGAVDKQTFALWRHIRDGSAEPLQKIELAQAELTRVQGFAPLWLEYAWLMFGQERRSDAEVAFRQGLACAEEPDVRTGLLAGLAAVVEDQGEKTRLLSEAIQLAGNLTAAAMARVHLLSSV